MLHLLDLPDNLRKARKLAAAVLSGEIDPNLGCGLIAELGMRINHPAELQDLMHLAHLQEGHESLGYTAEGCVPEIRQACAVLVNSK
jgi:hypothetical protein